MITSAELRLPNFTLTIHGLVRVNLFVGNLYDGAFEEILSALRVHSPECFTAWLGDIHPSRAVVERSKFIARGVGAEQFFAATHNPYIADSFSFEEVLCVRMFKDECHMVARPFSQRPDIKNWEGTLTTGELWSSVGEDWVEA